VFVGRLLVLNRRVAVSHTLPEISTLSKLTQIPNVGSGRRNLREAKFLRQVFMKLL